MARSGALLLALLAAGIWAAVYLDLTPASLVPGEAGWAKAKDFFGRAITPSLRSEEQPPLGGHSIMPQVIDGAATTVLFAARAIGLSLVFGIVLGFLGSTAWWRGEAMGRRGLFRRRVAPVVYGLTRFLVTAMRSVHEILWAIVFNAIWPDALLFAATLALTIPYAGTFAKLFGEIIDETPRDAALALRAAGASPGQVFLLGLVPRALPDLIAYTLYRFECALRSAAVLGWFGIPTLGYYISASFENLYYGEVWTYLYALLFLVIAVEAWSGAVRRRLVG